MEEILDSRWHWRRFQFLVKWKGFSREHNSWEVASNVKAPDLVAEYYWKHPAAVINIKWDYSYYQPWSDNEWLMDEMIAMREETLIAQNEDITMQ